MNTRKTTRSNGTIRSTIVIVITALLLVAGHSPATGQADPLASASRYFDWMLGRGSSAALTSPNSVLHSPEGIFRGQEGAGQFVERLRGSFTNLDFQVESSELSGDSLVVRFQMSGVHTGMYQGMNWDCAVVSVPGVAVLQIGDDGFSEQWITYDQQTLLDQIYVHSLAPMNERPSCDAYLSVAESVANPASQPGTPAGPPACLTRSLCETAF